MSNATKSERLIYREVGPADVDVILRLFSQEPVYRYICDGEAPPRAVVEEWVEVSARLFDERGTGLYLAALKGAANDEADSVERCIALTGFYEFHDPPVYELLFAIDSAHFRQGFGREMARHMVAVGFERDPQADIIRAATDPPNVGSQRVLETAGFRLVSTTGEPGAQTLHYEVRR